MNVHSHTYIRYTQYIHAYIRYIYTYIHIYIQKKGTTRYNTSPSVVISLLERIANLIKDYCATLSEKSIRKNFSLIYELLDETLDFGYPQFTSTETLKSYVHNDPIVDKVLAGPKKSGFPFSTSSRRTTPSSAVHKPVSLRYDHTKVRLAECSVVRPIAPYYTV